MRLVPGTRVGPYEVLASIGAGGMAEVYRAHDTRLQRDVALKVVREALATDGDFLSRLEKEARLAGSLNHPNIVAVYDVGVHDGAPYIVTELLQGETLRERLSKGAVPLSSALEWGVQMAQALATAHDNGIVHRDLKPENVFLSRAGHVKLLDFGIAKAVAAVTGPRGLLEPTLSPTGSATRTGAVLGTPGYMSPEQVQGETVDGRSDIFSFGAILYELLSGQRAFRSGSVVESGYGILHDDPAPLPSSVPFPLAALVQRCLTKDPQQRFQSARDLAFSLEAMRGASGRVEALSGSAGALRHRRAIQWGAVLGVASLLGLGAFVGGRATRRSTPQPSIRQLTFRRGSVTAARFAPDGRTVHFAAAWTGAIPQLFSTTIDSPDIRPLGVGDAQLLSVSLSGEMAVSLRPEFVRTFDDGRGTLARVPALGGTPRELATDVEYADWAPDGERLAVARWEEGRSQLEFPLGHVLFRSSGFVSHPRVSPSGDQVAFIDHSVDGDTAGEIVVVGADGRPERWTERFDDVLGLAWAPGGHEVLASAGQPGELWALRRGGRRLIYRSLDTLIVDDASRDGRVLVTQRNWRQEADLFRPEQSGTRSLEWLDWASVSGISDDGATVLMFESGPGTGGQSAMFLRNPDQPAPVKLGPGRSLALSADGKWVLASRDEAPGRVWLLPTGPGTARALDVKGLSRVDAGAFFRDGKRLALFGWSEQTSESRLYVYDIEGGSLRAISPPLVFVGFRVAVSPDQRFVACRGPEGILTAYPVAGGEPLRATGLGPGYRFAGWLRDGSLLAFERLGVPAKVLRYDLVTHATHPVTSLAPPDPTGVPRITKAVVTPDGRSFAFHYRRMSGALYVLDWGSQAP